MYLQPERRYVINRPSWQLPQSGFLWKYCQPIYYFEDKKKMNSWLCNMKRRQRIWNEQWTCQLVFAASPGARTLALGGRLKPPDWRWSKGEGWISWWEATPLTDWLSRAKTLNPGFMSPSPDPGFMYQTQVLWVRFQNKLNLASYQSSMYCWEENIIVAVIVKKGGVRALFI